jgi:beta-glucosidase
MAHGHRIIAAGLAVTLALLSAGGGAVGEAGTLGATASGRPWLDTGRPLDQRVELLLAELTLDERVRLMYGVAAPASSGPAGYVRGVARLGIPPLVLSDGPLGLRDSARSRLRRPATALPAGLSLAASFDRRLAGAYGGVLGAEARARGVQVLYGPAVNIVRHPFGGRNFEYLGEDPYLSAELTVPYVRAVQRHRVAAQVKHFALNEQENGRHTSSSNAAERTIREIYLPPFEAAVRRGGAWSVMCANNPVNGVYACENSHLLGDVLEGEWRFDGVVGSDYSATHSAVGSVRAGLDQSFSWRDWGAYYRDLPTLVRRGVVARATLAERVRRILRMMFRIGMFDPPAQAADVDVAAHLRVARAAAAAGTVLLRNDRQLLPLDPGTLSSVAVIGPYAGTAHPGGGGSSQVLPRRPVTPAAGIAERLGTAAPVRTDDGSDPARAAAVAAAADVAVVVVGDTAREGADRLVMGLPDGQDALIARVAAANPDTVVVLQTGGAVAMPWLGRVPALIEAWYPGEQNGRALAAVLVGDIDPSGRLPITFPRAAAQSPAVGAPRYPAGPAGYDYAEGLRVGYRGFDALRRTPLFPFGHGLSYATFRYGDLRVTPRRQPGGTGLRVRFTVANAGRRAGIAVPQVYLGFPPSAAEPPRQLKAFTRLSLSPGHRRTVTLLLSPDALRAWSAARGWHQPAGTFRVEVGSSSRLLPLRQAVPVAVAHP